MNDYQWTDTSGTLSTYNVTIDAAAGDKLLSSTMPRAEYMYGCTPTALGMLLGYYDMNGFENLIEGDVSVDSRGSDGNIYNMNEFDTALGRFIASTDYVERFFGTTAAEELPYAFVGGGTSSGISEVNISVWNCLADYIGTGQVWRNYSTDYGTWIHYNTTLQDILNTNLTTTVTADNVSRTYDWRFNTMLYGLNLYVESRDYALDATETGTFAVDSQNGSFTFEDYMAEIDAGRPVLVHVTGHTMTGYGYNASTREIIFDDCYFHDQRMVWGTSHWYNEEALDLQAITVIRFDSDPTPGVVDVTPPVLNGLPKAVVDGGAVTFSWSAASDDVGVTGYELLVGKDTYVTTGTTLRITDLGPGDHTYSLRAYDAAKNYSAWSNDQSFTIVRSEIDGVPPVLNGLPRAVVVDGYVTISWDAASDNVAVTGYQLRIGDQTLNFKANEFWYGATFEVGQYSFALRAFDAEGNYSEWSATQYFGVADPDAEGPVLIGKPSAAVSGESVTISWAGATDVQGIAEYQVRIGDKVESVSGTSYTLTLSAGSYGYAVRAVNTAGTWSDWSATQSFVIDDVRAPVFRSAPQNYLSGYSVTIAWEDAEDNIGVTRYAVKVNGKTYDVAAGATRYTLTNQAVGSYQYQVIAWDAAGNAGYSATGRYTLTEDQRGVFEFPVTGTLEGAAAYLTKTVVLQPGLYRLTSEGSGSLNAKIEVLDVDDGFRKVASGKVKNGVLSFKKPVLLSGSYCLRVVSSDRGRTAGEFSFEFTGSVFYRADNSDDDPDALKSAARISFGTTAGTLIADEWVGYGDPVDYREVTFAAAGKYVFDLTASDRAKLTVYTLKNGKWKAAGTLSVKAGESRSTKGILLEAGTYRIAVASPNAKKGGDAVYSVAVNGNSNFFTKGDNRDDIWQNAVRIGTPAAGDTFQGWVGFGDEFDYALFQVGEDSVFDFRFAGSDKAKLTLSRYDAERDRLVKVKTVAVSANSPEKILAGLQLAAGEYYLGVQSTNAKKGGNCGYTVAFAALTPVPQAEVESSLRSARIA